MSQVQPAPPRVVKKPDAEAPDLATLLEELEGWYKMFQRRMAAFNTLNLSYLSAAGNVPEGERKKGLPVFEFKATLDGRTTIDCVVDLKEVNPKHISHVMIPLINAQVGCLYESIEEIEARIVAIKPLLEDLTNSGAPNTGAQQS